MDEKTDKEKTLTQLKAQIAALEADLAKKDAVIDEYQSKNEGWLILTPNIMYDSVTADVKFKDGAAVIRRDQVLPRFQVELPPPNQLSQYTEEEQAQIIENSKIPSAQRAVTILVNDFGYTAEYFTKDRSEELSKRLEARHNERVDFEATRSTQSSDLFERLLSRHRL